MSPSGRGLKLWGGLTVCYWLLMVLAFHMPIPRRAAEKVALPPNSDKTIHVVIYGGFGLLLAGTLDVWCRRNRRSLSAVARSVALLGAASLYGFVDERTQPWTGRFYDLGDFYADVIGAAAGIAAFHLLRAIGLFRRLGLEG